jgi:hypothetical protein
MRTRSPSVKSGLLTKVLVEAGCGVGGVAAVVVVRGEMGERRGGEEIVGGVWRVFRCRGCPMI